MDVEADFAIAGVEPSPPAADGRSVSLRLGSRADVEHGFPAHSDRIAELHLADGRLGAFVDTAGEKGYLAYAFDFGRARVSSDGRDVIIAPLDEPDWIWQRYLTGQILPLAALLQGHEVFHACTLGLDGRAIGVFAPSGGGKTTIALLLALRGLDFLSDDVLVLEPDGGGVRAHPGIGLANVRSAGGELLSELERSGLVTPIGSTIHETRVALRRADEPLPFAALFVLDRTPESRKLEIERLAPVDPRALFSASFNFSVQTPERLTRQLDVCARLDRSASSFRVSCGSGVRAEEVADAILERAREPEPAA
jgi:hypothetical protein